MANRVLEKEDISALLGTDPTSLFDVVTCDCSRLTEAMSANVVATGDVMLIGICLQGQASISLNGFLYSGGAGTIMSVMPGSVLRMVNVSPDFRVKLFIGKIYPQLDIADTFVSYTNITRNPVVTANGHEQAVLFGLFDYIAATATDRSNIYWNNIVNKIYMLIGYEVAGIYRRRFEMKMKISENELIYHTFMDLVENHGNGHRDVGFYAKRMRLSPKTFGDKIKKTTGKTPSELIDTVIMDNAKTLLSAGDRSVKQISERLGFATPSLFCRYFKRLSGVSPMVWRRDNSTKQ